MRPAAGFAVALVCFFLSGFAGLLFQTVWSRLFSLVFGTSELAVATVLAAYMGGLAAGAAAAHRLVLHTRRPLLVYALLELGIGASALAVPWATRAATGLAIALFGGASAPPASGGLALSLFYLVCSFAILLVPTGLMGATLPLLARSVVTREEQIGPRVGALYAMNTVGAVFGALATAFALLPNLSLATTVGIGVALNFAAFGVAALGAFGAEPTALAEPPPAAGPSRRWEARHAILPLVLLAGVTSFSYEVLWTRLLGQIFGGTVYAFGTMLASFLTGIAIGGALGARLARTPERAWVAFALSQCGVALASVAAFAGVDRLPALALALGAGGHAGLWKNAAVAGLVLVPSAILIGMSFPLAVRVLARGDADAGPASARVYAWNTVGAIVGSIGAGFLWIPALGFHGALAAAAATNLAVAALAFAAGRPARRLLAALATAGAVAVAAFPPDPPWRLLSNSALNLVRGTLTSVEPDRIRFFAVGRSTTVMLADNPGGGWDLYAGGLPQASIREVGVGTMDDVNEWLGTLASLARPETRSMLLIGLGGGTTLEVVPPSVASIDVIELEPAVVEANRLVAEQRAVDPLADPRVHLTENDARGALMLTDRRWDAIVSEPSHPWTAGAGHLFSREFFALVHDRLAPGGVFVQWMPTPFVDEPLLRSLVATLNDVFPQMRIYWSRRRLVLFFLASDQPLPLAQSAARALADSPGAFRAVGVQGPEDIEALLAFDEAGTRRLGEGAPVSTDARNLIPFRAPRALADPIRDARLEQLVAERDPLLPPPPGLDPVRLARRVLEAGDASRAARIGAASDPASRLAIEGLVALQSRDTYGGRARLREALALAPGSREASVALVRQLGPDAVPHYTVTSERAAAYPELDLVARAFGLAQRREWEALRALDAPLAAIPAADPLYPDVLRLRALWRVEAGGAAAGAEAEELIAELLPLSHFVPDVVLGTRAAAAAGRYSLALRTLDVVLAGLQPENPHNALLLPHVERALREIPSDGEHAALHQRVSDALARRRAEFGTGAVGAVGQGGR